MMLRFRHPAAGAASAEAGEEGKAQAVGNRVEAFHRESPLKLRLQLKPDLQHPVRAINRRRKSLEGDSDSAADPPQFPAITPSRSERAANN
jgi:hypothetical protein